MDLLAQTDVITHLFGALRQWIDHWPAGWFSLLLRLILVFALPCLLCSLAFKQGSRSVLVQTLCFVIGLLLACSIPVENIVITNAALKTWVVVLCAVVLLFLPAILPMLVAPTLGLQRRLRVAGYLILFLLIIANCFRGCGA